MIKYSDLAALNFKWLIWGKKQYNPLFLLVKVHSKVTTHIILLEEVPNDNPHPVQLGATFNLLG